jgi:mRNA interferase YafO
MTVNITKALKAALQADNLDEQILLESFQQWKESRDEYGSYLFGKDSAYTIPKIDGKSYRLRHVHLPPLSTPEPLEVWNKQWQRRGRKTSDRVLVYVEDDQGNYLLIFILPEPMAHEIAKMQTPAHRQIMESFASVATKFLETGQVIA